MGDDNNNPTPTGEDGFTNVMTVCNGELLTWCISPSDPVRFQFPDESRFGGWSVLSPVIITDAPPQVQKLGDGRYLVFTKMVNLEVDAARLPDPSESIEEADSILQWLRLVTGHAGLAASIIMSSRPERVVRGQLPEQGLTGRPLNDVEKNAIMFERMTIAARLHPACEVPTYTEILHDAIEAHAIGDCRKAILYSAIAVEEMAATRLEEGFAIEAPKAPDRFRVVDRRGSEGPVQKDPVFEYLQRNATRDFRLLLDAMPAYVFGRSMSDDRNELHSELLRLRSARNNLAHRPGRESDKGLPFDEEGAHRALHAAIDAFEWFGAPGRYPVNPATLYRTRRISNQRLSQQ